MQYEGPINENWRDIQEGDPIVSLTMQRSARHGVPQKLIPFRAKIDSYGELTKCPAGGHLALYVCFPYGAVEVEPAMYEDFKENS